MSLVWLGTLEVAFIFDKYLSHYVKPICVTEAVGWIVLIREIQKGIVAHLTQTYKLIN